MSSQSSNKTKDSDTVQTESKQSSNEVKISMEGSEEELLSSKKTSESEQSKELPSTEESNEKKNVKTKKKEFVFKEKEFKIRKSLLSTLHKTEFQVIYNLVMVVFCLIILMAWFRDYLNTQNPFNHFWIITLNFSQLSQTFLCWITMFTFTILIPYYGLLLWIKIPVETISPLDRNIYNLVYLGFLISLFSFPIKFIYSFKLSFACSMIITCENTRMAMKVHSFLRETYARGIKLKQTLALTKKKNKDKKTETKTSEDFPTIEQYIYFLFAPTFIYRDNYPRNKNRNWVSIGSYALQCLFIIYLLAVFFELWAYPVLSSLDHENKVRLSTFIYSIFLCIPVAIMTMIGIFYGILHSWLNMFAELLLFGDRHFYDNWWAAKTMAEYYRNWNLVVHEWLYTYVYRDFILLFGIKSGSKIAQFTVLFISAIFHEYWFAVSLRIFFPVIFITYFLVGGLLFEITKYYNKSKFHNMMLWFNLIIGTSFFYAAYGTEYYAEDYCFRVYEDDFLDFVVPRIFSCIKF